IINYVEHIQPLWTLDRGANTCTNCHAPPAVTGRMAPPAGQLDLSGDPSPEEQQHLVSYRELLFNNLVQDFVGGTLVNRTRVNGTDPETGDPILQTVNATRSLTVGNARESPFFSCLTGIRTCRSRIPLGQEDPNIPT